MVRTTHSITSSLMGSSSRLHTVALLQGVEPSVEAACGQKLLVGAVLRDPAVLDHEDPVHAAYQPELVGYDEGGAAPGQCAPIVLHRARRLGVEAGLGLVQDQDGALSEHRPRDGDALALPPGEALPALREQRVVALRQFPDKPVRSEERR